MKKITLLLIVVCFLIPGYVFSEDSRTLPAETDYVITHKAFVQAEKEYKSVKIVLKDEAAGNTNAVQYRGTVDRTMLFFDPDDNPYGYVILIDSNNDKSDFYCIAYSDIAAFTVDD